MSPLNGLITNIEKTFNMAECAPVLCIYSGILRTIAGKVQQAAGWIFIIMGAFGSIISRDSKWEDIYELGFKHIVHGALNTLRGCGTVLLSINTFGVGNILLLIPNILHKPAFGPRYGYNLFLSDILTSTPISISLPTCVKPKRTLKH